MIAATRDYLIGHVGQTWGSRYCKCRERAQDFFKCCCSVPKALPYTRITTHAAQSSIQNGVLIGMTRRRFLYLLLSLTIEDFVMWFWHSTKLLTLSFQLRLRVGGL